MSSIKFKLDNLPQKPGVYLMKDKKNLVIYVGKAKNLSRRVKSYFQNIDAHDLKTKTLVSQIVDFDVILLQTEVEALLLERTLIRKHQPQYNILFRDDKEYPYLKINLNEKWPRILKVRKRKEDDAFYFGPFGSHGQVYDLLKTIYSVFPVIRCSPQVFDNAKKPCHYYHMKQCLAPCSINVDENTYKDMLRCIMSFLKGKDKSVVEILKKRMLEASDKEDYETALSLRNQISSFKKLKESQNVIISSTKKIDVIGFSHSKNKISFTIQHVRKRKLLEQRNFILDLPRPESDKALSSFILQFYSSESIPEEILCQSLPEEKGAFEEIFYQKNLKISVPLKGQKKALLDTSIDNARYALYLEEKRNKNQENLLEHIKKTFALKNTPQRIECIDISNLHKESPVASVVCFMEGKPKKNLYRFYNIKNITDTPNDFESIYEAVKRRLQKGFEEQNLPDLLIIDGGKGQLSSAQRAFKEFFDVKTDLVSLAKSKVLNKKSLSTKTVKSHERVFQVDRQEPVALELGSKAYKLFTQIRDESHRFALKHHRRKREKKLSISSLENIDGIGPTLKKRLFEKFKDLKHMKEASLEEIMKTKGLAAKTAKLLFETLKNL